MYIYYYISRLVNRLRGMKPGSARLALKDEAFGMVVHEYQNGTITDREKQGLMGIILNL